MFIKCCEEIARLITEKKIEVLDNELLAANGEERKGSKKALLRKE